MFLKFRTNFDLETDLYSKISLLKVLIVKYHFSLFMTSMLLVVHQKQLIQTIVMMSLSNKITIIVVIILLLATTGYVAMLSCGLRSDYSIIRYTSVIPVMQIYWLIYSIAYREGIALDYILGGLGVIAHLAIIYGLSLRYVRDRLTKLEEEKGGQL